MLSCSDLHAIGPDMKAGAPIDQAHVAAKDVFASRDRAFDEIAHAKLGSDGARVLRGCPIGGGGMARADGESADAAESRGDFLRHEVAEIRIARRASLRKIVEREEGDRRSVRDLGHEPRFRTLKEIGPAQRRAKPMCRLRGGPGIGQLKGARRTPGDLCTCVIHQRTDFKRGFEPRRRERVGAGLVSPLRASKVTLRREAPDQEPVALLA